MCIEFYRNLLTGNFGLVTRNRDLNSYFIKPYLLGRTSQCGRLVLCTETYIESGESINMSILGSKSRNKQKQQRARILKLTLIIRRKVNTTVIFTITSYFLNKN